MCACTYFQLLLYGCMSGKPVVQVHDRTDVKRKGKGKEIQKRRGNKKEEELTPAFIGFVQAMASLKRESWGVAMFSRGQ